MNIYNQQPYTYFLFWKIYNKKYYGCQYGKKASPINILLGKYKTSSKYVKQFWKEHGPPDYIVIHRVFSSVVECREFETSYLKKVDAVKNNDWLNKTDNKSIAPECSGGAKAAKLSYISRMRHKEEDPEFKEKLRQNGIKNFTSESAMLKRKETFKVKKHSQGERNPRYGVKLKGTETALRISIARKLQVGQNKKAAEMLNTKNKICEVCGKNNLSSGNYKRWHHTNCKKLLSL